MAAGLYLLLLHTGYLVTPVHTNCGWMVTTEQEDVGHIQYSQACNETETSPSCTWIIRTGTSQTLLLNIVSMVAGSQMCVTYRDTGNAGSTGNVTVCVGGKSDLVGLGRTIINWKYTGKCGGWLHLTYTGLKDNWNSSEEILELHKSPSLKRSGTAGRFGTSRPPRSSGRVWDSAVGSHPTRGAGESDGTFHSSSTTFHASAVGPGSSAGSDKEVPLLPQEGLDNVPDTSAAVFGDSHHGSPVDSLAESHRLTESDINRVDTETNTHNPTHVTITQHGKVAEHHAVTTTSDYELPHKLALTDAVASQTDHAHDRYQTGITAYLSPPTGPKTQSATSALGMNSSHPGSVDKRSSKSRFFTVSLEDSTNKGHNGITSEPPGLGDSAQSAHQRHQRVAVSSELPLGRPLTSATTWHPHVGRGPGETTDGERLLLHARSFAEVTRFAGGGTLTGPLSAASDMSKGAAVSQTEEPLVKTEMSTSSAVAGIPQSQTESASPSHADIKEPQTQNTDTRCSSEVPKLTAMVLPNTNDAKTSHRSHYSGSTNPSVSSSTEISEMIDNIVHTKVVNSVTSSSHTTSPVPLSLTHSWNSESVESTREDPVSTSTGDHSTSERTSTAGSSTQAPGVTLKPAKPEDDLWGVSGRPSSSSPSEKSSDSDQVSSPTEPYTETHEKSRTSRENHSNSITSSTKVSGNKGSTICGPTQLNPEVPVADTSTVMNPTKESITSQHGMSLKTTNSTTLISRVDSDSKSSSQQVNDFTSASFSTLLTQGDSAQSSSAQPWRAFKTPSFSTPPSPAHTPSFSTPPSPAHTPSFSTPPSPAHTTTFSTPPSPAHTTSFSTPPSPAHTPSFSTPPSPAHTTSFSTPPSPAHITTFSTPPSPAHITTFSTPPSPAHTPSFSTPPSPAHTPSFSTPPSSAHTTIFSTPPSPAHTTTFSTPPSPAHTTSFSTPPWRAHTTTFSTQPTRPQTAPSMSIPPVKGRVYIVEDQPAIIKEDTVQLLVQIVLAMDAEEDLTAPLLDGLEEAAVRKVESFLQKAPGFQELQVSWASGGSFVQSVATFSTTQSLSWLGTPGALLHVTGLREALLQGVYVRGIRVENITVGGLQAEPCSWLFQCPPGFGCVLTMSGNGSCTSVCHTDYCKNHGICVHHHAQQPTCQCPVGEDFWFMGRQCDIRMTRQRLVGVCVALLLCVVVLMCCVSCLVVRRYKAKLVQAKAEQTRSSYRRFNHFDELSGRFWLRSWPGSVDSLDNPGFTRSDELLHLRALDRTCCYHDDSLSIISTCQSSGTHLNTIYRHSSQYNWDISSCSVNDFLADSGKASDLSVCSWPIEPIQWTPFPLLQQLSMQRPPASRSHSYCEGMELVDMEKT